MDLALFFIGRDVLALFGAVMSAFSISGLRNYSVAHQSCHAIMTHPGIDTTFWSASGQTYFKQDRVRQAANPQHEPYETQRRPARTFGRTSKLLTSPGKHMCKCPNEKSMNQRIHTQQVACHRHPAIVFVIHFRFSPKTMEKALRGIRVATIVFPAKNWCSFDYGIRVKHSSSLFQQTAMPGSFLCDDIHGNRERMLAAAHDDPFNRCNIAIVAPPGQGDVAFTGNQIVGGIQVHPSDVRNVEGKPGMRRVGPHKFGLARRRQRFQVSADVSGRQT